MNDFKKGEAYYFDEIYAQCKYKIREDDNRECNCNNGYICTNENCTESCEDDETLGKCYSWSCPLVADTAPREAVRLSTSMDETTISFDKDVAEFMRKNKKNTKVPTSTEVNAVMRKHYRLV